MTLKFGPVKITVHIVAPCPEKSYSVIFVPFLPVGINVWVRLHLTFFIFRTTHYLKIMKGEAEISELQDGTMAYVRKTERSEKWT